MNRETAELFSPFGEADCESELKLLKQAYREYFFYHTPFNSASLDPSVFLVVGRRGSGKTALTHFFSFQDRLKNAIAIDVDEPAAFDQVLQHFPKLASSAREVSIPRIVKIWEFTLWSILFYELQKYDVRIRTACIFGDRAGKLSTFIRHTLKALINRLLNAEKETDLLEELETIIGDERIQAGKTAVLELARRKPVIMAIDTLENYAVNDAPMMQATAALIQCASDFNRDFSRKGLHVKLFVMAEIFPYLKEEVVLNTLKFVRNEVYLHWRPKDLLRLICWRYSSYLSAFGKLSVSARSIDWDDYNSVLENMWKPYFGETISNTQGIVEQTFPYVLRHTQMRPRQLIVLCNAIAHRAITEKTFPKFTPDCVVKSVLRGESALAEEVLNSYSSVYPKVGRIVEALTGLPMMFKGNELDKRASLTASEWTPGEYSQFAFRQLVAELGIVGRVRRVNEKAGYVEADFEYSTESRLPLMVTEECVIHPMFYQKLNVKLDRQLRVYPFPDHQEYRDLEY
jgi:hypothetical protein